MRQNIITSESTTMVGRAMFETWDRFIKFVWNDILANWRLVKNYREKHPDGLFFQMTFFAVRDALFMKLCHVVKVCEKVAKVVDPGPDGRKKLDELKTLARKGEAENRELLDLGDVGVFPFRNIVIGHPASQAKFILAKPQYTLELTWNTVHETIEKLREFCRAVELHHLAEWKNEWFLGDLDAMDHHFDSVVTALEDADKYRRLKLAVSMRNKPRIFFDWNNREFVLED